MSPLASRWLCSKNPSPTSASRTSSGCRYEYCISAASFSPCPSPTSLCSSATDYAQNVYDPHTPANDGVAVRMPGAAHDPLVDVLARYVAVDGADDERGHNDKRERDLLVVVLTSRMFLLDTKILRWVFFSPLAVVNTSLQEEGKPRAATQRLTFFFFSFSFSFSSFWLGEGANGFI